LASGTSTLNLSITAPQVAALPLNPIDRLYGLQLGFNDSAAGATFVSIDSIKVRLLKSGQSVSSNYSTVAYQPYSCWQGPAIPAFASLQNIVQKARNTASSLLYTDFSSQLDVNGLVFCAQVNSRAPPAESGILGIVSIENYAGVQNFRERQGCYSAPLKCVDIESSKFSSVDDTWYGSQNYTVILSSVTSTNADAFYTRVQLADVLELKVSSDQILPIATMPENRAVIDAFYNQEMKGKPFICENPLHLSMIKNMFSSFVRGAKILMPMARAAANASGDPRFIKGSQIASSILDSI